MSARTLKVFLGCKNRGPLQPYIDLDDTRDGDSPEDWLSPAAARSLALRLKKAADRADDLSRREAKKINRHKARRRAEMKAEELAEEELFAKDEHSDCEPSPDGCPYPPEEK